MHFYTSFLVSALLFSSASVISAPIPIRYSKRADTGSDGGSPESDPQPQNQPQPQTSISQNWSGMIVKNKANDTDKFTKVSTSFVVPNVTGSDGGASIWCGIDGDEGKATPIIQAGIYANMVNGQVQYSAWTEWYPSPAQAVDNFNMSAGDVISVTIDVTNATQGVITMNNLNSGQQYNTTLDAPTTDGTVQSLPGQTAEFIVEAYQKDGSRVPLVNFDPIAFTTATVSSSANFSDSADAREYNFKSDPDSLITSIIQQNGVNLTAVQILATGFNVSRTETTNSNA